MYFLRSGVHAAHAIVGLLVLLAQSILDWVAQYRSFDRWSMLAFFVVVAGLAVLFALDLVPYLG